MQGRMSRTAPYTYMLAGAALLVALSVQLQRNFKVPTVEEQSSAVGSLEALPLVQQRAFAITDDFATIVKPAPEDWLTSHYEARQTYNDFLRSKRNLPSSVANTLYILPLGEFKESENPRLDDLREYAEAYFGLPVKVLAGVPLAEEKSITRRVPYGNLIQFLSTDILEYLKRRLPKDAYCMIGVTMEDLYPEESWNFVFGQASLADRVGVFSFKRYTPEFNNEPRNDETRRNLLRRSCMVLAHETGHMFGIRHCTFFECLMCGSNHLKETDARPMHLCPVCLRKLHASAKFDLVSRYHKLLAFYEKHRLADEAQWTKRMLSRLTAP
jgi:archaemetzincin